MLYSHPVRRSYVRKTIDLLSWDSLGQKHRRQNTRVNWRLSVKCAHEFASATCKSCSSSPARRSPVVRNTVRNGVTLHDYNLPAWNKYLGDMLMHRNYVRTNPVRKPPIPKSPNPMGRREQTFESRNISDDEW